MALLKSIIDSGPIPSKVAVSWRMCRLCVRNNGRAFSVMCFASRLVAFRAERGGSGSLAAIK